MFHSLLTSASYELLLLNNVFFALGLNRIFLNPYQIINGLKRECVAKIFLLWR